MTTCVVFSKSSYGVLRVFPIPIIQSNRSMSTREFSESQHVLDIERRLLRQCFFVCCVLVFNRNTLIALSSVTCDQSLPIAGYLPRRSLFRLSGRLGNGEKGNKAHESWWEGKRKRGGPFPSYPARPRFFNFPVFSLLSPFSSRFPTEGTSAEERALIDCLNSGFPEPFQFNIWKKKYKNLCTYIFEFTTTVSVVFFLIQSIAFFVLSTSLRNVWNNWSRIFWHTALIAKYNENDSCIIKKSKCSIMNTFHTFLYVTRQLVLKSQRCLVVCKTNGWNGVTLCNDSCNLESIERLTQIVTRQFAPNHCDGYYSGQWSKKSLQHCRNRCEK